MKKTDYSKKYLHMLRTPTFLLFISIYILSYSFGEVNFFLISVESILVMLLVFIEYDKTKKFVSPLIVWYVFWLFSIILARIDLQIYELGSIWNDSLMIYVSINTVVFYFSYILCEYMFKKKKGDYVKLDSTINVTNLAQLTIVLFLISNIAFVLNVLSLGYVPQLSTAVNSLRQTFVTTPLFSIVNISRITFAFIPIVLDSNITKKMKRYVILSALISIIFNFLTGWRGYVFQILIILMTSQLLISRVINKKQRKKEKKLLFRYFIVALLSISIIAVSRANSIADTLSRDEYLRYTLEQIYLYITPNFLNFQQALSSITPNNNLLYTSEFIWGLLIDSSDMIGYVPLSFSTGSFNVSTYLLHPYADFGIFGTVLWTSLIAIASVTFYRKSFYKNPIFYLPLVGICNVVIFNMHNGFFLRSSSVVIWVIICWLVSKVCVQQVKSIGLNKI